MLYDDDVKNKDYHIKALENYGAKDAAIELYKYLVNNSGGVLLSRQILEKAKSIARSLMFYVDTIHLIECSNNFLVPPLKRGYPWAVYH